MTALGIIALLIGCILIVARNSFAHPGMCVLLAILLIFGGMLIGIGGNPAENAPNGSPGMVSAGVVCIVISVLLVLVMVLYKNKSSINMKYLIITIATIGIIAAISGIYIAFNTGNEKGTDDFEIITSVTCPKCSTGYRSNHPMGEYIQEHGYCTNCEKREKRKLN